MSHWRVLKSRVKLRNFCPDSQKISWGFDTERNIADKEKKRQRNEQGGEVTRREKEGAERRRGRKGLEGKRGMETSKKFQTWRVPTSAQFIHLPPKARAKMLGMSTANCDLLTVCSCTRWGQQIPLNVKRCGETAWSTILLDHGDAKIFYMIRPLRFLNTWRLFS